MNFDAQKQTIRDVFSSKKEIIVPRFQREFVWEIDDKLAVFWDDILDCIEYKNNKLNITEYFLGTLVLIDDLQNKFQKERYVVDGQQRLTAITIFLSALFETFKKNGNDDLAENIYKYIISTDDDNKEITLLKTESPKPFFQCRIQQRNKDDTYKPNTNEEERLLAAYNFFIEKLSEENLLNEFKDRYNNEFEYLELLRIVREQVLNCIVVYVAVVSMNDAYMIFEVLNAKGEPLNAVELIKNALFQKMKGQEPIDYAVEQWKRIKNNIESEEDIETFYRHYWLAKYHFTNKKKLYQEFEEKIKPEKYNIFLTDLLNYSTIYKKIIYPNLIDWKKSEKIKIFHSLEAFSLFKATQVRTILLTLFLLYNEKLITINNLNTVFVFLENFHFVFSAICSSRPSGLESKYSKYSIMLQKKYSDYFEMSPKSDNEVNKLKQDINRIIKKFIQEMKEKIPNYENFEKNISKLWYTKEKEKEKDKPIILYIFKKIERFLLRNNELDILIVSIEHINPQSANKSFSGRIGNLLPLDVTLNSDIGSKPLLEKIPYYKESNLNIVKKFCTNYIQHENKEDWNEDDTNKRTKDLSKLLYDDICKNVTQCQKC